jgi:hypothetical protein
MYRNLLWEYQDTGRLEWDCENVRVFDDSTNMSELKEAAAN